MNALLQIGQTRHMHGQKRTIVAFGPKCEKHGCDTVVSLSRSRQQPMTLCPMCCSEYNTQASRDYRARHQYRDKNGLRKKKGNVAKGCKEGIHDRELEYLWNVIADRKIAEFWAARGMTEEDARIKFGCRIRWPKRRKA